MLMIFEEVSRDNQATDSVIEPGPSIKQIQPISNAPHRTRTFSSASESEDDAIV